MTLLELYENHPSRWIQKSFAKTASGRECSATDIKAQSWCLLGAVNYCFLYDTTKHREAFDKLRNLIGTEDKTFGISTWNDTPGRTHAEVVELVRKAGV